MDIIQKRLPIIEKDINLLLILNKNKNKNKINTLVGKYIIFELIVKTGVMILPGKLLEYKDNYLLIRQYDDGTEDTKKIWIDYDGTDLFKDFEEKIHIDNIRGIEEYKMCNPNLVFKESFKNSICEIINRDNKKITALITGFDGFEILFNYKYQQNNEELIGESSYPLYLTKSIEKCNLKGV